MNSGMGAKVKTVTRLAALATTRLRPLTPPMNRNEPTMLTPRKANATGTPSIIKAAIEPTMMRMT